MASIEAQAPTSPRFAFPLWLSGRPGLVGIGLSLYTLLLLAWTYFHWGGEENISLIGNLAILPPMLIAALMCWRITVQSQLDPRLRRAWFLLGLGTFLAFLGEATWAYLENMLGAEPFPSVADIFYLGYYPLMLWGLLTLPGSPQNRRERLIYWLELIIILTSASMFVGYFLIVPTAAVNNSDLLIQLLATAYPVCSLILLGGVMALLLRQPDSDTHATLLLLLLGFSFFLASDLTFGYANLAGTYVVGSWIDVGWHIAQVFTVLASLRQMYQAPALHGASQWITGLNSFVRKLPGIAAVMGYGLVFYIVIIGFDQSAVWLLAGALLLTAFVIGHQIISPAFANLPIRAKVILTFFLVSVISVSLVTLMSYLTIHSNLQSVVGINLKAHARDRAGAISSLLSKQSDALEGFALSQAIQDLAVAASARYAAPDFAVIWDQLDQRDLVWRTAADNDPLVQAVLNNKAAAELHKFRDTFPGYIDLLLTDKYGAVLAATTRPATYDQSILSWWQAAFHKGQGVIYMSQPILDPGKGSRYLVIAMPVRTNVGSDMVGMLMATYSLKDMAQLLAMDGLGQMYDYSLLLPTGQMLTSSDRFVYIEQNALERLYEAAALDFTLMSFEGKSQLVSQALVTVSSSDLEEAIAFDGLNWTIIAHQERAEAFAPLNAAWKTTLFSILVVLSLTTGLAVILAQVLVAPISRLTAVARQIEAGNLSTKALVESRDEIGGLAGTFNTMLEALLKALAEQAALASSNAQLVAEIELQKGELEIRVAQRTAELNMLNQRLQEELVERQQLVQSLRDQERQLAQVVTLAKVAYWELDLQTVEFTFNDQFYNVLRTTAEKAGGYVIPAKRYLREFVHPEDVERIRECIQTALTPTSSTGQLEYRCICGDGQVQHVLLEYQIVFDSLGNMTRVFGAHMDITDRQRLVQSLSDSEARFRLLFEASPDAILLIDPGDPNISWPIVDCNQAACTMNGFTREELIGQSIDIINEKPGSPTEREMYLAAIRKQGVLHRDGFHRHKLGHLFPIEVSTSLITFGNRELVLGIDRDITERKQTELALQRAKEMAEAASRAKSEFLSRMSHELRTPMNAILGFAQLLDMSRKEPLTPIQKERVKQITKGGQHLLDLINEILDISRIEAGRLQISPEPVPVRESIQEVLDLTAPLAANRHIELQSSLEVGASPYVMADRQRLKQVLLNLLSNAVKYNHDGGFVMVSCHQISVGGWRISVTDTGQGIPQENIGRLFRPFERLVEDQSNVEGTGLGLALAKRLVELMKGHIGVESAVGQGSTFWIELPAAESQLERLQRTGTGQLPVISSIAHKILYVEDNIANFELIQQVLADYSQVELLWATELKSAIELTRQHHPNLILLDLHLDGKDGAEVLQRLKENKGTEKIPVIVVSADATPGQIERMISLGAYSYLTKPLDMKRFIQLIEELLNDEKQ